MNEKTVFVTHKDKLLMQKLRSAVVNEFLGEWIFLHNNQDETSTLEVCNNHGGMLSDENFNKIKMFVDKFMIDNDNSSKPKNKKSGKKELPVAKTEILA